MLAHICTYIHTHYRICLQLTYHITYAKDVVAKILPQVELFFGIYCISLVHNYVKTQKVTRVVYRVIGKDNVLRFFVKKAE